MKQDYSWLFILLGMFAFTYLILFIRTLYDHHQRKKHPTYVKKSEESSSPSYYDVFIWMETKHWRKYVSYRFLRLENGEYKRKEHIGVWAKIRQVIIWLFIHSSIIAMVVIFIKYRSVIEYPMNVVLLMLILWLISIFTFCDQTSTATLAEKYMKNYLKNN